MIEALPTFTRDTERVRMVHTAEGGWSYQKGENGLFKRSAKGYRVTSPERIGAQLEAKGFAVERCLSLFSHGRFAPNTGRRASPWKYGLEVLFPGATSNEADGRYQLRARILLANNGREALKIALGALRLNCTNQFTACLMAIRHTDGEVDGFLSDPAAWLWDARGHAEAAVRNLGRLRGLECRPEFWAAVEAFPRLVAPLRRERAKYFQEEYRSLPLGPRSSFWTLAQALTGTRSPRLVRASMHLLQTEPEALVRGECDGYFRALQTAKKN